MPERSQFQMCELVLSATYKIFVSDTVTMQRTLLYAALNPDLAVTTQERAALVATESVQKSRRAEDLQTVSSLCDHHYIVCYLDPTPPQ